MNISKIKTEELLGGLNSIEEKNAPADLYYSGDTTFLKNYPCVSIIGSRKVSDEGKKRASYLTRALVEKGVVIVSGLAEGVDTVAHQTAISSGGKTVAVLGTPLNEYYPKENKDLQNVIMTNHLAVSQFSEGTITIKSNFPIRNRTMALLSNATVIVEAQDKSGTIHQGYEALRLGRPFFILESMVKDSTLTWPAELIKYGAQTLTKDNLDFLIELLPYAGRGALVELTI